MRKTLKIALAAAALASSQAFAAEVTAPFEVTQFDRILPNVVIKASAERAMVQATTNWLEPASYAR